MLGLRYAVDRSHLKCPGSYGTGSELRGLFDERVFSFADIWPLVDLHIQSSADAYETDTDVDEDSR